jgi:translation initiation factor IF-2
MAITCPRCGAGFDVTLFQFGHRVRCACGEWVDLRRGHLMTSPDNQKETLRMSEKAVGVVTHYFGKIQVAGIRITDGTLRTGDRIHVVGHTSDFTQSVDSIQIDGKPVEEAGVGDEIGIRVADHAREHDVVYRIGSD